LGAVAGEVAGDSHRKMSKGLSEPTKEMSSWECQ
jgi:hypothetical protein